MIFNITRSYSVEKKNLNAVSKVQLDYTVSPYSTIIFRILMVYKMTSIVVFMLHLFTLEKIKNPEFTYSLLIIKYTARHGFWEYN